MYHTVYPQMVYALNAQETGLPGSSAISLYDGVQFLSLANSQESNNFASNTISMAGATMGTQSLVYGQNNMVFSQGNILSNQQQTHNVLAISNSNNIISLANSLESNHTHAAVGNNAQYNSEASMPMYSQSSQRLHQNYAGPNKQQFGNNHKEKKYSSNNYQYGYNKHNQNNHKHQMSVFTNGEKQQQQNQCRQSGMNKSENLNQNNNYQHHNRNHQNMSGCKKNWSWPNKQRHQNKNMQSFDCLSSTSSSSSARMSSVSPSPVEVKNAPTKKDLEEPATSPTNIQISPRKSPTLGEFMVKTLIVKDRQMKHCTKHLSIKHNNVSAISFAKDNASIATNNCIFSDSWPDHYGFSNQQPYYNNKNFRINHHLENKQYTANHHLFHGYNNQAKKRDGHGNKALMVPRDHRPGACYQRIRRFHLALAKDQLSNADKLKSIGHSIPYSLHNLIDLCNYYNFAPFESLPYYSKNFFVPADRFIMKSLAGNTMDDPKMNSCEFVDCGCSRVQCITQIIIFIPETYFIDETDKLSQAVWNKFLLVRQTKQTYHSKLMLWKYLFLFIKNFHARYSLFLVGSTMTGFASNSSDVDFCLIVKNSEIDQRNEAQLHLEDLFKLIIHNADDYFKDVRLFPAKVPILRFHDTAQDLDVDLNCNNFVGIRNTHLLHCYHQMNWRLRPLVIIVKQWARGNQMNSARESTISSYSLTLMVIHYLQCGVTPPILPCLHAMYPGKFDNYDIHSIDIHEKLEPYKTDNKQSLGDILLGFFEYYSRFDYSMYAISVRLAKLIKVESCKHEPMPKNDPGQWMYICIEEPFDRTNTARSVYLYNMFLYIKSVFQLSYKKLKQTRDLDRIMDLGLSIPDSQSSSPPPKGSSNIKTEYKKPKFRNECCLNEISEQKIELSGC